MITMATTPSTNNTTADPPQIMDGKSEVHLLVCVTGSVAAVKVVHLLETLQQSSTSLHAGCRVVIRLVSTGRAEVFLEPERARIRSLVENWFRDDDEWSGYKRGDPVLHIELRRWADVMLIAPLSANTLAKIASGLCDTLLTCIARAWDFSKPCVVAPAMNTMMWEHPLTAPQIHLLETWGVTVVPPVSKRLACGDTGMGAMANLEDIRAAVEQRCALCCRLKRRLEKTAGTTVEITEQALVE